LALEAQQILNGWAQTTHVANAIGWGLALVLAVQVAFNISGSHLNPAVSFNAWTFGHLSFRHFLLYSLAQTAGGYFGALLTYSLYFGSGIIFVFIFSNNYLDKIAEFDEGIRTVIGPNATADIFSTYPGPHLGTFGAIIDQVKYPISIHFKFIFIPRSAVRRFFVFAFV
jgi:glycerol uptake facilitator-like aquaporin